MNKTAAIGVVVPVAAALMGAAACRVNDGDDTDLDASGAGAATGAPSCPVVYSDEGMPGNSKVWVWDGGDWGLPEGVFDGHATDCRGAPEGSECYLTASGKDEGNDTNYAGWGVFRGNRKANWNLSSCTRLIFCVYPVGRALDLKVEIQTGDEDGDKFEVQSKGMGPDTWNSVVIQRNEFGDTDFSGVFGIFLVTVENGNEAFYVDYVRWDDGTGSTTCESGGETSAGGAGGGAGTGPAGGGTGTSTPASNEGGEAGQLGTGRSGSSAALNRGGGGASGAAP